MLVVVNQPHINEFMITGTLSPAFLNGLKKEFGDNLSIKEVGEDEEWVNFEDTDWHKGIKAIRTPAYNLAFYRKEHKLTQAILAGMLGTQKQVISDMEHGRKAISKRNAKKLSEIFNCNIDKFI